MGGFGASQEAMHAGATAVREAQQAITAHIGTLRGEVDRMIGDGHGDAGSAFTKIRNSFEESANRISSALARMHDVLVATHQTDEEPDLGQKSGT